MIEQYKQFFLSDELTEITPYAQAIIDDDVETFVRVFEPYADKELMIDPIEIAAAYHSAAIFDYLVKTYDYSDYHNPFRLTLPVVLMVFERESMLVDALDAIPFGPQQMLAMYEHMVEHKDVEYFKQFYKAYGIDKKHRRDLLKISLSNEAVFDYLVKLNPFKKHLKHESIVYEIIAYHQHLLPYIEFIEDLSEHFEIDAFVPVLKLEDSALFERTIDFLLERKLDLNTHNEFGLTFFHEALRHAVNPEYVFYLHEKGGNPFFRTDRGYPSAHQLLFQAANFCLELSRIIDFDAEDYFGLTLSDYDAHQRKTDLQLLDVLLVVKLVLNMDESAIYELDNAEFYDLAGIHGIDLFLNAYSVIAFENASFRERFQFEMGGDIEVDDVTPLKDTLGEAFPFDVESSLELINDLIALEDDDFEALARFARENQTRLVITTDGADVNKIGHVEIIIESDGTITKHATVHTNYLDVYYLHQYYDVPFENITYIPPVSKGQRFLS